jgi:putative ABC transport system permease protein
MQSLVWRLVAWHLGRHLTAHQLSSALGDLAEEFESADRQRHPLRRNLWLLREAMSVAGAYARRARQERRGSGRRLVGGSWLEDARFARRRLIKAPAASAVSALTLGCAIAAGAVAWSLLSALLLHPLPVSRADELVVVGKHQRAQGLGRAYLDQTHVYTQILPMRESEAFAQTGAGGTMSLLVTDRGTPVPRQRTVYFVSHDLFETLGVRPSLGREFGTADDRRGAPLTAVLSERYWQSAFGGNPGAIGQVVTVAGVPATVIGVAPRRFRGLNLAQPPDLYVPLLGVDALDREATISNPLNDPTRRGSPSAWITIVGRLKPGSNVAQAQARLNTLSLERRRGATLELIPIDVAAVPEAARESTGHFSRLLGATVALLLLIGSVTVGMLLLVRTEARRTELAVCLALGSTRLALARGVVLEGAMLACAGVALAVPLGWWLFSALSTFQLPGGISIEALELSLDWNAWVGVAACGVLATILIAMAAGASGFTPQLGLALHSRGGATDPVTPRRTRAALLVAQVAVSLVLVGGAVQLTRSLVAALTINTGFDASRVVTGRLSLRTRGYTGPRGTQFFADLHERLRTNPAVSSASLIQGQGGMTPYGKVNVDGQPRQFPITVQFVAIDEHYFSTMGLPVVTGRDFTAHDDADSKGVAVVSESFGRLLANGGNPVGHTIINDFPSETLEIIGVVPDVVTNVAVTEPLVMYRSLRQGAAFAERLENRTIVLRAAADPTAAVRETLGAIRALDPRLEPEPLMTLAERLGEQMGSQRLGGLVLGVLGGIAVLLTLLGAYVLAESMAVVRKREFGIRTTLGASRPSLAGMMLADTVTLVGGGIVVGLGLAWLGASTIETFLFRVDALEPGILIGVSAAILLLAIVVTSRPVVTASRVDLVEVLRDQ